MQCILRPHAQFLYRYIGAKVYTVGVYEYMEPLGLLFKEWFIEKGLQGALPGVYEPYSLNPESEEPSTPHR